MRTHRAPTTCPVCSTELITLRLGCPSCATELSGHFESCRYCRLDATDAQILEVFLRGRGNVRDVQAHLGVSYPTARVRLSEVLEKLGLAEPPAPATPPAEPAAAAPTPSHVPTATHEPTPSGPPLGDVLRALATGQLSVDQAEGLLEPPSH